MALTKRKRFITLILALTVVGMSLPAFFGGLLLQRAEIAVGQCQVELYVGRGRSVEQLAIALKRPKLGILRDGNMGPLRFRMLPLLVRIHARRHEGRARAEPPG